MFLYDRRKNRIACQLTNQIPIRNNMLKAQLTFTFIHPSLNAIITCSLISFNSILTSPYPPGHAIARIPNHQFFLNSTDTQQTAQELVIKLLPRSEGTTNSSNPCLFVFLAIWPLKTQCNNQSHNNRAWTKPEPLRSPNGSIGGHKKYCNQRVLAVGSIFLGYCCHVNALLYCPVFSQSPRVLPRVSASVVHLHWIGATEFSSLVQTSEVDLRRIQSDLVIKYFILNWSFVNGTFLCL